MVLIIYQSWRIKIENHGELKKNNLYYATKKASVNSIKWNEYSQHFCSQSNRRKNQLTK